MPVDGLPLVLENIINSIIEENEVDSWIMRGFKGYSQLTLKFKMASSDECFFGKCALDHKTRKYINSIC